MRYCMCGLSDKIVLICKTWIWALSLTSMTWVEGEEGGNKNTQTGKTEQDEK